MFEIYLLNIGYFLLRLLRFLKWPAIMLMACGFLIFVIWLQWPDHFERCVGLAPRETRELLRDNRLSFWYSHKESDTAFIFVHGFMSDNVAAWCHIDSRNPRNDALFPELLRGDDDPNLAWVDIHMAGFFTSYDSGEFDIPDAARTLYSDLRRKSEPDDASPLSYPNLVFIAHSAGGVIVRQMIIEHQEAFRGKTIGLFLVASPAGGSYYADNLGSLIQMIRNDFAEQLRTDSEYLKKLDESFRGLQSSGAINICGKELMEHRALYGVGPIQFLGKIVETEAAGNYFGEAIPVENTDHSSIAKPDSREHRTYKELYDFYVFEYCGET